MNSIRTVNSLLSCKLNFIQKKRRQIKSSLDSNTCARYCRLVSWVINMFKALIPKLEARFFNHLVPFSQFDFCSRPLAVTVESPMRFTHVHADSDIEKVSFYFRCNKNLFTNFDNMTYWDDIFVRFSPCKWNRKNIPFEIEKNKKQCLVMERMSNTHFKYFPSTSCCIHAISVHYMERVSMAVCDSINLIATNETSNTNWNDWISQQELVRAVVVAASVADKIPMLMRSSYSRRSIFVTKVSKRYCSFIEFYNSTLNDSPQRTTGWQLVIFNFWSLSLQSNL